MDVKSLIKERKEYEIVDPILGEPIFYGDSISVSITLNTDDIRYTRLNTTTPYESRRANLSFKCDKEDGYILHNEELMITLDVTFKENIIYLDLETKNDELSEFGLNLPFNFMGKKNGGDYSSQYLFNSAYRSIDNKFKFCFINSIKRKDIVVAFLSEADGWKIDYSPWVGGHYFINLKCLANFDQAYNLGSFRKHLSLALVLVDKVESSYNHLAALYNLPVLSYKKSYTFSGEGEVFIHGKCDRIEYVKDGKVIKVDEVKGDTYHYSNIEGKVFLVPYYQNNRGLDVSILGIKDLKEMIMTSNDFVANCNIVNHHNLCEGQFWALAMLKSLNHFENKEIYHKKLKEFFDILLPKDPSNYIERLSFVDHQDNGLPDYSVYKSTRIQEHFAGVSILLEAYKVYKDKYYLEYATKALDSLLDNYQKCSGAIVTSYCDKDEDYSTVTCIIFPIIDMANTFKEEGYIKLYEKYRTSATRLADFIYKRGMNFPTEGGSSSLAEPQMEDGSISCAALSLLYYSAKIERREDYILKAKEILDLHDLWIMKVCDANVFYSTNRWWETRWEDYENGPALCCGHGWTIWRSEADYWYYYLTKDENYLIKCLNGFTSNLAKYKSNGDSISCYQIDMIPGGGYLRGNAAIKYEINPTDSGKTDLEVSRYVYARMFDTILNLTKEELNK